MSPPQVLRVKMWICLVVSPLPQEEETMRWKCAGTFDSCRPVTGIEGNMAGLGARASVQRDASIFSVFSAR